MYKAPKNALEVVLLHIVIRCINPTSNRYTITATIRILLRLRETQSGVKSMALTTLYSASELHNNEMEMARRRPDYIYDSRRRLWSSRYKSARPRIQRRHPAMPPTFDTFFID